MYFENSYFLTQTRHYYYCVPTSSHAPYHFDSIYRILLNKRTCLNIINTPPTFDFDYISETTQPLFGEIQYMTIHIEMSTQCKTEAAHFSGQPVMTELTMLQLLAALHLADESLSSIQIYLH